MLGGGSSPLTRGKRRARLPKGRRVRLIPAHAGKTPRRPPIRMSSPAHPRSRGENQRRSSARAGDTGSSPLTRGKRKRAAHAQRRRRLIPAHAGKTRGDVLPVVGDRGSSPLTRGKRHGGIERRPRGRLIPAHAGKTLHELAADTQVGAHPRSRGENLRHLLHPLAQDGSSPLTRGKQRARDEARRRQGLIPAHAGKTSSHDTVNVLSQAHPRSRGENRRPQPR